MLKSCRQVLHRKIADILRNQFSTVADAEPEIVAHHLTLAGLIEAAIDWWEKAGQRSLHSSAYNEAIAHLEEALSIADGLPDSSNQRLVRLRIQTAYGYALFHGRGISLPETIAAFAKARKLATEVEEVSARFSAYFGLWSGSLCRADLAPMQEVAGRLSLMCGARSYQRRPALLITFSGSPVGSAVIASRHSVTSSRL